MLHLVTKYEQSKKDKKKAAKTTGMAYPPSYCNGCEFKTDSGRCLCEGATRFARKAGARYVFSWLVRGTYLCERKKEKSLRG